MQPHPEFRDGFIDGLIEHRGGAVPGELLDRARARRGDADSLALADRIEAFFKDPEGTAEAVL